MLNVVELKDGIEPPVVFLHGFTQTAEVWRCVTDLLDVPNRLVAIDLPGHGGTPADHDGSDLAQTARLVGELIGEPAMYVGYSLGARILVELMNQPVPVVSMVLVGAKLPISGPFKRMQRKAEDEKLAELIEKYGTEEFIDEWLQQPFNAVIPDDRQFRDLRCTNRKEGLAASLRTSGSAEQQTQVGRLPKFKSPVTILEGDRELPQVKIDNRRLLGLLPNAELIEAAGVGHSMPFEEPFLFADLLASALQKSL